MCLIMIGNIADIEQSSIERAFKAHPHGAGIAYSYRKGRSKISVARKGFMSVDSLLVALDRVPKDVDIAIHFRYATHGSVSQVNTHPFPVGKDRYVMHNGVLPLGSPGMGGRSDSAHLAAIIRSLKLGDMIDLLGALDGRYAVVTPNGVIAVNELRWYERAGILYSNRSIHPLPAIGRGFLGGYDWSENDRGI